MTTVQAAPAPVHGSGQVPVRERMTGLAVVIAAVVVILPLLGLLPAPRDNLARVVLLFCAVPVAWLWSAGRSPVERADWLARGALPAFVAAFTLTALLSDSPRMAMWGAPGRLNGPLTYAAGVALCVLLWRRASPAQCRVVLSVWTWSAVAVAAHALLMLAGLDPLGTPVNEVFGQVAYGVLGNPNFAAVYFAMSVPVAVWNVADRPAADSAWARAAVVLLVAAALLTQTVQAPLTLLAAALPALAHRVLGMGSSARRRLGWLAGPPAGVLAVVAVAGLLGHGPLAELRRLGSVDSRLVDWVAAWRMFSSEPLVGVGPGQFMWHYSAVRPPDEILTFGWGLYSDQAHSVPLDLLAAGGVLLLGAYLLVVGGVVVRIWDGVRALSGPRLRMLLAAAGAWSAYQVDSLIGIDEPTLVGLQWIAAGLALALVASAARTQVDGAPLLASSSGRLGRPAWRAPWALGAVALLLLPLAGEVREDTAGPAGRVLEAGRWAGPYWPDHLHSRGRDLAAAGRYHDALARYRQALAVRPRDHDVVLHAARAAAELSDWPAAAAWYERFMGLEPHAIEVVIEYATLVLDRGLHDERARQLVAAARQAPYATAEQRENVQNLCEWAVWCTP